MGNEKLPRILYKSGRGRYVPIATQHKRRGEAHCSPKMKSWSSEFMFENNKPSLMASQTTNSTSFPSCLNDRDFRVFGSGSLAPMPLCQDAAATGTWKRHKGSALFIATPEHQFHAHGCDKLSAAHNIRARGKASRKRNKEPRPLCHTRCREPCSETGDGHCWRGEAWLQERPYGPLEQAGPTLKGAGYSAIRYNEAQKRPVKFRA
jgi:hypothetical protein